jgi:chemotaxis protein CheZ
MAASFDQVSQELAELSAYIRNAKAELAQLRPDEIGSRYIASATDELDAIVGATETATNTILDNAERLQDLAGELEPVMARRVTEATTMIFEACNFQDITGQRITKVVSALKHIEARILALVSAFGVDPAAAIASPPPAQPSDEAARPTDAALLNGPQLAGKAHSQAAIDALFNKD